MGTSLNGLTPAGTYPGLIKTGDNAPIDGTLKTLSDGNGNNLPMEASTTAVNFTGTLTQAGTTLQPTLVSGTNIKTINGTSLLGSGNIPVVTSPSGVAGAIQFSNGSAFASDAANLFWDDTNNRLGVGTNAPTAILQAQNATNGVLLARFKDAVDSTSYIDIKNDATLNEFTGLYFGTDRRIMSKQGGALFLTCSDNINFVDGLASKMTITPSEVQIGSISGARLGIKGSGSTSATTSLLVQNSAGTQTFKVADDGVATTSTLLINNTLSFNSADYGSLGLFAAGVWNFNGGGINDTPRINWGGYTSLFPSLKRNGTAIDVRLADDSNYASLNTGATTIKGSGSTSATTSLLVQNSSGTAALTIKDDLSVTFGGNALMNRAYLTHIQYINASNTGLFPSSEGWLFAYDNATSNIQIARLGYQGTKEITASLQVDSTTQGFLPPRMTTTQKNNISSPASGLVVYDSTTNKLCCYNGSTWNDLF